MRYVIKCFKIDTLTAFNTGKDNLFKKLIFEKGNYLRMYLDIIWYNENYNDYLYSSIIVDSFETLLKGKVLNYSVYICDTFKLSYMSPFLRHSYLNIY